MALLIDDPLAQCVSAPTQAILLVNSLAVSHRDPITSSQHFSVAWSAQSLLAFFLAALNVKCKPPLLTQKTRESCGCFRDLVGFPEKIMGILPKSGSSGKVRCCQRTSAGKTPAISTRKCSCQELSGSNATPLVSRYSCRATLVSHFSPYAFAVSHENRATPLKVLKKALLHPFLGGGGSHLKLVMHIS